MIFEDEILEGSPAHDCGLIKAWFPFFHFHSIVLVSWIQTIPALNPIFTVLGSHVFLVHNAAHSEPIYRLVTSWWGFVFEREIIWTWSDGHIEMLWKS
jgi:hypothetical protein